MSTTINRPITRETPDRDPMFNQTLMVRLEPGSKLLRIWQKGRRKAFAVRYADIYRLGFMAEVRASQAAKAKGFRRRG